MYWLEIIQIFWPVAVTITPLVCGAGFLWLRTQFPTKADLKLTEETIGKKIDAHEQRLADGSKQLAELDKRVALVEDEQESAPTKADLDRSIGQLSSQVAGLESSMKGVHRQLATQNDYLHTLIERGLQK